MQIKVAEKEAKLSSISPKSTLETVSEVDTWTPSLIGVIRLDSENTEESYVNYLEEKLLINDVN
ncbi:MAG TPA: hypothetical protein VK203_16575 [Nostocaceae cyanobacterium]|nr:hypothetical protein [Nostocaceae cyanobacterium]